MEGTHRLGSQDFRTFDKYLGPIKVCRNFLCSRDCNFAGCGKQRMNMTDATLDRLRWENSSAFVTGEGYRLISGW
jgi:hypothetical protein